MGLIACPDCGKEVSDQAPSCPECGRPIRPAPSQKTTPPKKSRGCGTAMLGCFLVGIIGVTVIYIIGTIGTNTSSSKRRTASTPSTVTFYNTASSLNIRAEPKPDGEVVGKLGYGEKVRVTAGTDTTGGEYTWIKIKQGWVVKNYLSKSRPLSEKEKIAGKVPQQSGWNGSYLEVKQYLRQVMHDPSSLEWEGCTKVFWEKSKQAYLVGCAYRGNNAFGAKIKNANWFIIRHGQVVEMKDSDAFAWE